MMLVTTFSLYSIVIINGLHFRGGIITWEPDSSVTNDSSNITVIFHQRYAWSSSLVPCNQTNIFNRDLIGYFLVTPLVCLSSSSQSNAANYSSQQIASEVYCTDFNVAPGISFDRRSQTLLLLNSTELMLVFCSTEKCLSLTYGSASAGWSLPFFVNLAPRVGIGINLSPTSTMPLMVNAPIRI
ncbi:unnamed protein product [Rotaria magnacalcarata]|uniref:Uncharacterized protein n=1 Tax=Rotaria magnacalcarata TaxID=392030 RepID=A0A816VGI3_9BILA|nr:unnamed protein product [Rotaria magnacalcarata]CAF2121935.1 unnamed protein product [Rotaria magnacalcarata]CAF3993773.1 unnamed protein product [Rotaria magnacalcarata]CAF4050264.1 unnamed protein product [Rotaria magnacalcarata]